MLAEFVGTVANILKIAAPAISFDVPKFQTDTLLAAYDPDHHIIFLKRSDTYSRDTFFAVAHELRHAWQYTFHKDKYFSGYQPSSMLSVEAYNLQLAEIDANAFAAIIMTNCFGIKPLFNGLDDRVKQQIYDRAREISSTI